MRRSEKFAWSLVAILALGLGFVAFKFVAGSVRAGDDGRTEVVVSKDEHQFLLEEMRTWLQSTQTILDAAGQGDFAAVATAATDAGMKVEAGTPAQLLARIPLPMKQLGFDTRAKFDAIAADAATKKDVASTTALVADAMNNCIACHASYRFSSAPASGN